jgi:hypothetical protein
MRMYIIILVFDDESMERVRILIVIVNTSGGRLPFLSQSFAVGLSDIPDALNISLNGRRESLQVVQEISSGTFTRANSQTVTPVLQRGDAGVFHVGEARGVAITLDLICKPNET